jgi:hypothetical protein
MSSLASRPEIIPIVQGVVFVRTRIPIADMKTPRTREPVAANMNHGDSINGIGSEDEFGSTDERIATGIRDAGTGIASADSDGVGTEGRPLLNCW